MSILSENEKFTRKLCDTLSKTYGVPYDLVRAIIDGLGFYVLHTLAEKGKYDRENGIKEKFKIEIPMIGTLELTPKKYNNTSAIKVSKFDGKTLVSGFKIREPYLAKIREAYYGGEDLLVENAEKNFNKFIIDNYAKIISAEGEEDE